jgi:hypothetical protein|tara:strand:+ start:4382 stop:4642 length:261 start_codon:yes stop_codon:yes gene_type:complete
MQRDTPKFDEPECSAPVAKRKNKQFVLERRYVSPVRDDLLGRITSPIRQWRVFRKYRSARDRQRAIENMERKGDPVWWQWEYRISE